MLYSGQQQEGRRAYGEYESKLGRAAVLPYVCYWGLTWSSNSNWGNPSLSERKPTSSSLTIAILNDNKLWPKFPFNINQNTEGTMTLRYRAYRQWVYCVDLDMRMRTQREQWHWDLDIQGLQTEWVYCVDLDMRTQREQWHWDLDIQGLQTDCGCTV